MQSTKKNSLSQLVLTDVAVKKIKLDTDLFMNVSKVLNVSHFTLPDLLRKNDQRLTQASVLRLLKTAMSITDENELLVIKSEKMPVKKNKRVIISQN